MHGGDYQFSLGVRLVEPHMGIFLTIWEMIRSSLGPVDATVKRHTSRGWSGNEMNVSLLAHLLEQAMITPHLNPQTIDN